MQSESGSTGPQAVSGRATRALDAGTGRVLAASLRVMVIPVVFLVLAGFGAFAYAIAVFVHSIDTISGHPFPVGRQVGLFLLDIDLFLIGVTLLISAVGLYHLFIGDVRAGSADRLPAWLETRDLDDLKGRVVSMIVLVLAVTFVEVAVDEPTGLQALELGGGITLVIVALAIYARLTRQAGGKG